MIRIYNFNNKLQSGGCWIIVPPSPETVSQAEITLNAFQPDGTPIGEMKYKIHSGIPMLWGQLREIDWLLHCDVGMWGDQARDYYEKWWGESIQPTTQMVALRLHKLSGPTGFE